jgi:hydroxypyruvate reductase
LLLRLNLKQLAPILRMGLGLSTGLLLKKFGICLLSAPFGYYRTMQRSAEQLRQDALRIWQAGVEAVKPPRLIYEHCEVDGRWLRLGDELLSLDEIDRIAVVGGGKAAAGMAVALEQALGPGLLSAQKVAGWVNIPADCLVATDAVHLHPARPPSVNEPTEAGVQGVARMLRMVAGLGQRDLCIAIISGGGSALMPAPIDGLSLADKLALTQELSARGATIEQLNVVRRELSAVKGGGLARACRAGRLVSLIISDIPGDDLSLVASGPTVCRSPTPEAAIAVLEQLALDTTEYGRRAIGVLKRKVTAATEASVPHRITNLLLANNATAVDAAGVEAERLGYSHAMISATAPEGAAEEVATGLVEIAERMRRDPGPDCLISGGEPTVRLAPQEHRGRGGRNQQLCLAALAKLADWRGLALLSGGTDGEDGPTDAAGACVDELISVEARRLQLDSDKYLARNDAYSFFEQTGGLLKTGPTHTNVCDLRVITVSR